MESVPPCKTMYDITCLYIRVNSSTKLPNIYIFIMYNHVYPIVCFTVDLRGWWRPPSRLMALGRGCWMTYCNAARVDLAMQGEVEGCTVLPPPKTVPNIFCDPPSEKCRLVVSSVLEGKNSKSTFVKLFHTFFCKCNFL